MMWTALWSRPICRSITLSALICRPFPSGTAPTRVGPLAERVSTDALWRLVFGRWLRCMVAGWVQATAGGTSTCGNAMIPLLVSEEQGVRKSTFCRMLLPPELRNYYTDKFELAGDERLELALSRFALVNLDEFDRYNKLHNAKLKNLVQLAPCKRAALMLPDLAK